MNGRFIQDYKHNFLVIWNELLEHDVTSKLSGPRKLQKQLLMFLEYRCSILKSFLIAMIFLLLVSWSRLWNSIWEKSNLITRDVVKACLSLLLQLLFGFGFDGSTSWDIPLWIDANHQRSDLHPSGSSRQPSLCAHVPSTSSCIFLWGDSKIFETWFDLWLELNLWLEQNELRYCTQFTTMCSTLHIFVSIVAWMLWALITIDV